MNTPVSDKKTLLFSHLALFTVNVIYGLNFVIAKDVMPQYIQPAGFIFIRVLGANILFWLIHTFYPSVSIDRKDWWRFIAGGFFGVAANQLLFFMGLNLSTPINASVIMVTTPIVVLMIGILLANEKLTWLKSIGIVLGAFGALRLILQDQFKFDFTSATSVGNLYVMMNAFSYAIYMIIAKPLMKKYPPLMVIKWMFFFGMIFVIPFGWNEFTAINWNSFPTDIILKTAYIILGVTFITYLFNIYALKHLNPSIVSIYIYVQPAIASMHAIIAGKDGLDWLLVNSCLLIFCGVFLVSRNSK